MATHNEVCHAWANQTGKQRRGFNMHYDGPTIYSYRTPMARIYECTNGMGNRCILLNERNYSSSTSKHKSYIRRAVSGDKVFEVPHVGGSGTPDHRDNHEAMIRQTKELVDQASRARIRGPWYLQLASDRLHDLNQYRKWFDLDVPELAWEDINPAYAEIARRAEEQRRLEAERQAERHRLLKIKQREQERKTHETLLKWLEGESVPPPRTTRPYVRVKDDVVETSWGAKVPLEDAIKVYRLATEIRQGKQLDIIRGDLYKPEIRNVGDFCLNEIDKVGTVHIGCHVIGYRMMHMAAKKAGLAQ